MLYLYNKKIGQQICSYDSHEVSEPVTKAIKDTNENIHRESQSTTKAIEELNDSTVFVNASEMMNQSGIIDGYSISLLELILKNQKLKANFD